MRIKKLENKGLLVILSQGETDRLGFHPEGAREYIRTKAIAEKIYKAIRSYAHLSDSFEKMHIKISFFETHTLLLFSPVKKYRIKGCCSDMIFRFESGDDLIDFFKAFSKTNDNIPTKLYYWRGKYFLVARAPYSILHSFITKATEYSVYYAKSSAVHRRISEHGKLIFSDKNISSILI